METSNSTVLPAVPFAKKSKYLGYASMVFAWFYGAPGILFGILALYTAKKAVTAYHENPDAYDTSSLRSIMIARFCALLGLIFSGLAIFYFTSMMLLQA